MADVFQFCVNLTIPFQCVCENMKLANCPKSENVIYEIERKLK